MELAIDDGTYENRIGAKDGGTPYFINRLTPATYPATLKAVAIYFQSGSDSVPVGTPLTILFGSNPSGSGNINGLSFQQVAGQVQSLNQFSIYSVPDLTITSGDFVVGFRITHGAEIYPAAQDTTTPLQHRSYYSGDGSSFRLIDDYEGLAGNFGIRARVSINQVGTTINLTWRRSPVWTGNQSGPRDVAGRAWNDLAFDDPQWAVVAMPDSASSDSFTPNDRYYRAHFNWDGSSTVRANFSADDGLAIYVNGGLLGSWGSYRQFGCVNGPPVCTINTIVSPQTIPASLLRVGDNVIAVDLWNAGGELLPQCHT